MPGHTVETHFKAIVSGIVDRLRKGGFVCNSLACRKAHRCSTAIVQFQRSMANSRNRLSFTVNLGVAYDRLLREGANKSRPNIVDCQLRLRLGAFLPAPTDKWWEVVDTTEPGPIENEIAALLVERGLPYLERYAKIEEIVTLWQSGESPGLTDLQRRRYLATLLAEDA